MSGLFAGCRACLPIFAALVGSITFFYLFFFLSKKYPKILWTIIVTSIVVSIFTLTSYRFIFPRFLRVFSVLCGGQRVAEEWIVYDTDPRNDVFIKGRLQYAELKRLDKVLMREKNYNDGMRLDDATLNEFSSYDSKIIDAYDRWRKCKDMRRSYHKSIYPDERRLYHYLRD